MRYNFVFYKNFYDAIKELSAEEKTLVILKILQYEFEEEQTENIELSGVPKAIFELIKLQLDRDNLAYENGKKGGRPKTTLLTTLSAEKEKEKNQKKKNKDIYNTPLTPQGENPCEGKVHFAEFVTMTNAEHEKLVSTYGEEFTNQCIEVLDNYKGSKGKTYKNDYRAILSWVVDRVKQNGAARKAPVQSKEEQEIEAIYERLGI